MKNSLKREAINGNKKAMQIFTYGMEEIEVQSIQLKEQFLAT